MKIFKSFFLVSLVSVFVLFVNSCKKEGNEELGPYQKIRSAEGFQIAINTFGTQDDPAQILDFRSAEDFNAGHIPGAIKITATFLNTASNNTDFCKEVLDSFDSTKPLLIYGGNAVDLELTVPGRISKIGFGYANTYVLSGGFETWKDAEYPIEK